MKRVLLTSVCRPFGERYGDGFLTTPQALFQVMWAQGPFRIEDSSFHWGLDVIAANVEAPTVVLHYPSLDELRDELEGGGYDYVGISFVPATFHKVRAMVPVIRDAAPGAEIVLGGAGTALDDDELHGWGDHLCRGEGIAFMRELLGEDSAPPRPFATPPVFFDSRLFTTTPLGTSGVVFAGTGCTRGCDFCLTSAYFGGKRVRFLETGEELLRSIEALRQLRPDVTSFVVYDEDFLQDEGYARGFLEAVRKTDIPLGLSVFGSVESVSRYEPTELVEMGVSTVWIGFEAVQGGYERAKGGDLEAVVEGLREVGISTTLSMIVGLEHHTLAAIDEELERLLALRPRLSQFMLYSPTRGSPLFERLKKEGRLNDVALKLHHRQDGSSFAFDHPRLSAEALEAKMLQCARLEFERLGPSIYRQIEIQLQGYRTLREASAPRLTIRAEMLRQALSTTHPAFRVGRRYAPNRKVADWIADLERQVVAEFGPPRPAQRLWSRLAVGLAAATEQRFRHHLFDQPKLRRHPYRSG